MLIGATTENPELQPRRGAAVAGAGAVAESVRERGPCDPRRAGGGAYAQEAAARRTRRARRCSSWRMATGAICSGCARNCWRCPRATLLDNAGLPRWCRSGRRSTTRSRKSTTTAQRFHKSLRGSDVQAALYWAARMLVAGRIRRRSFAAADLRGVGRCRHGRSAGAAAGDRGVDGVRARGLARGASCSWPRRSPMWRRRRNPTRSIWRSTQAMALAQQTGSLMPPKHILNAPTKLMKELGYDEGYRYDHDYPDGFSGQEFFPGQPCRRQPAGVLRAERARLRARGEKAARLLGAEQAPALRGRAVAAFREGTGAEPWFGARLQQLLEVMVFHGVRATGDRRPEERVGLVVIALVHRRRRSGHRRRLHPEARDVRARNPALEGGERNTAPLHYARSAP